MLKNGYWFNLESLEWESKRFPPNPPFVQDITDALYSFRGSPTFFGSPVCDENGECEYREVLWYDLNRDIFVSLGNMIQQRFNHEVILHLHVVYTYVAYTLYMILYTHTKVMFDKNCVTIFLGY